jgi:hypothetical protein
MSDTSVQTSGLVALMPLEDHPWGDRGFGIQDPNGIVLYLYSEREPSPGHVVQGLINRREKEISLWNTTI